MKKFFKNNINFVKSSLSGILTLILSIVISNLNQFYFLIFLDENVRTDINLFITFIIVIFINFTIHNIYVFNKNFSIQKLFSFYVTNLLNLVSPILFWNIYEYFFNSPSLFAFNFWSILIILILFPIKYFFYEIIYKN